MGGQVKSIRPEIFDRTELKALYSKLSPVYEATLQGLYKDIRSILEKNHYHPTVKYRVKRFDNYFEKLVRMKQQGPQDKSPLITDVLGLRIVCPFLEDLESVERLLADAFEVVELERKGARHSFREFGYDSVHLLIRLDPWHLEQELPFTQAVCEIQLRTILQDAWAEVEHELIYKSDISLPNESIKRKLASLNATLTLSDLIFQEIRDYQKEIRERDRKRRQSLEAKLGSASPILLCPSSSREKTFARHPPLDLASLTGQSKLERAMVEALEAHSSGKLELSIRLYSQLLRLKLVDSIRALVYNHRGMAYFALSEYPRSIKDFSKAIEFDPRNVRCFNNRGLVFRVLKRFDRSLEDYDRSLAIKPSQFDAHWGRAQTFYEMKLFTQALSDCEKVLSIQADFEPAQALMRRIAGRVF